MGTERVLVSGRQEGSLSRSGKGVRAGVVPVPSEEVAGGSWF